MWWPSSTTEREGDIYLCGSVRCAKSSEEQGRPNDYLNIKQGKNVPPPWIMNSGMTRWMIEPLYERRAPVVFEKPISPVQRARKLERQTAGRQMGVS